MHFHWSFCSAVAGCTTYGASPASERNLDTDSVQALNTLTRSNAQAAAISKRARSVLVFPNIVKAGLGVGGAYGEGELRRNGVAIERYRSITGSWGLQAGAQSYGYAVFLMTKRAEDALETSDGWEIGVGPTVDPRCGGTGDQQPAARGHQHLWCQGDTGQHYRRTGFGHRRV